MKSVRIVKLLCTFGVAGIAVLTAFAAFQLPNLSTRYSVRQFFPKEHPVLKTDAAMDKIFQLQQRPAFFAALELEHGTWLEPRRMETLTRLTRDFAADRDVRSTLSLGTVEMATADGEDLRVGGLVETFPPDRWERAIAAQPLLTPQLISTDRRSALIVIEPKTTSSHGLEELEARIRSHLARESGMKAGIAGVPAVQSRLSEKLSVEVGRFLGLCLLMFCLMFALFYRNFAPVIFAGVGLVVVNTVVLGFLALFQVPFTVLLTTLPIILSIAFVSLSIHTLHLWADRLVEAGSPMDPLSRWSLALRVLREILLANALGSVTTAMGFITLALAPIPVIKDYGLVVSGSVIAVFLLAQILFLVALPWFTPVQRRWTRTRALWTLTVIRWSGPVFVAVVGLCVFLGGAGVKLNFSSKLFDDLPWSEPVSEAMRAMDRSFGGTVTLDMAIDAGRKNAWTDPKGLAQLRNALREIRSVRGVGAALAVTDFMGDRLPSTRAGASEVYFLYSMAGENPLRHFVDNSLRRARVSMRLPDLSSASVDRIRGEVRSILQAKFPQAALTESGIAVNSHTINREVAHELVYGFWQSLLIIGLLLAVVFRSVRWALVACLPNLVPPAVLIGTMALFQTPIKPAIALIFSIALGLAFNNTVYLLSRLRRLREEKKMKGLPLRRAMLEEGNPCLSESLLMFAGFLIFLTSDFKLNQTFGAYMVLSIVAGFLGDLVFLPAVLRLFPGLMGASPLRQGSDADSRSRPLAESGSPTEEVNADESALTPSSARKAAAWAGLFFFATFAVDSARADEGADLLKRARQSLESKSDQATVTLKIIEANGDAKTRKMTLKTSREGGAYRALVRIQSPADIKGTALLAEIKGGQQNQWLYLPSSRQVRRIVSGKKSAGLLGSELNPEDLNVEALRGTKPKILKKDAKQIAIEARPRVGSSLYDRVVVLLALPETVPLKLEYSSKSKVIKTVEFKDYVAVGGVHRARRIEVRNFVNHRGTDVELADVKVNAPMKASEFSVGALKRGN